uniref:Mediator of RNA polymerase II transcription subunit 7 n=1 Tax=Chloropicon laureae TaxID=464258 RepID=A0A7S2Z3M4_9CHLO|mmetsp:Transcript_35766/g.77833  ORF Transcript_35766/g.77833 Transcript_35766/m.77833 type:complete len:165 (+) Transcript_35766:80-574(+)
MEARAAQPPPPRFYTLYERGGPAPAPPQPIDGQFQQFGVVFDTKDAVAKSSSGDAPFDGRRSYKASLKRLNREALFMFIDLVDTLAKRPSEASSKVDNLRTGLLNLTNSANALRAPQARSEVAKQFRAEMRASEEAAEATRTSLDDTLQHLDAACQDLLSKIPR